MPIEFAPPQPNLQGFNVPPPQSTDPLQTLAQMGQLRTQNLQREGAELQLQNERMQVQSTQGLMRAYQEAGGDPVKMATLAPKYGVMPDHMMKIQQMLDEQANKRAQTKLYGSQADKDAMEALDRKHDALNEAYTPVFEEKDPAKQQALLGQINQNLVNQGYDATKDLIPPNSTPDAIQQAKHAYTTLNYLKAKAEEQEKAALTAKARAETAKTGLDTAELEKRAVAQELQAAEIDKETGTPTPAARAQIQANHPNVKLPENTPEAIKRYVGSVVPVPQQPEYQMKAAEAAAMGNLTPEAISGMVSGSIDQKKYGDQYQRTVNDAMNAVRLGLGVKGVQAAIKDGSDRIAARENALAQAAVTSIPFREAQLEQQQYRNLQSSYQYHNNNLTKMLQPAMQTQDRIFRLNEALNQNTPQGDALVAPELLSVMAGGSGSGLRMTDAEINRIVGGRSKWEDLKAAANRWQLNPSKATSITPEQRREIRSLVDAVTKRSNDQVNLFTNAQQALGAATGPEQHKAIMSDLEGKLIEMNKQAQPGAAPLPKGGGKTANASIIKQFLDANPGNKDAARKALIDNGWLIPKGQ